VQTNAGTFDYFKITYDSYFKAKIMGIGIPINMKVTEWFSPKLGRFVKSETYRKDKLAGCMVLEPIN
jgi:phosphotransferase system IIA component